MQIFIPEKSGSIRTPDVHSVYVERWLWLLFFSAFSFSFAITTIQKKETNLQRVAYVRFILMYFSSRWAYELFYVVCNHTQRATDRASECRACGKRQLSRVEHNPPWRETICSPKLHTPAMLNDHHSPTHSRSCALAIDSARTRCCNSIVRSAREVIALWRRNYAAKSWLRWWN